MKQWLTLGMVSSVFALSGALASAVAAAPSLVPLPAKLELGEGVFTLTARTRLLAGPGADKAAAFLADALRPATGYRLLVSEDGAGAPQAILLTTEGADAGLGREGYALNVTPERVIIRAPSAAGLFYGVQTLCQLLPPAIYSPKLVAGAAWTMPAVRVTDQPRFAWRGLHLDVCRHYMPVASVKKYIDLLALHKMNTFHWHLTDDQGWRIEIKKYPRLTEVGSRRDESPMPGNRNKGDGKPYGPFFYTQVEVREIVAYAAERHVTVVPEIEMPGHALGALVAYPDLSCTGGPFKVRTRWGVEEDVFCAGNDKTLTFVEDVLTEVLDLFPSSFIHVGGDECPKSRWEKCPKCQARMKAEGLKNPHELQSWFIRRMDRFLTDKGRRLIGWDEILEGGLAPGAAVMSWRGINGGIAAAKAGHDVVMSPTSHCYFDFYQSKQPGEPEAIGGFLPLRTVYDYEPVPAALPPEQHKHVLGAQGNLWTEYIATPEHLEYMAYPRGAALAEGVWTPAALKNYEAFTTRLETHLQRLDALGVNYRKLTPEPKALGRWKSGETTEAWANKEWDLTPELKGAGKYRIVFQFTGGTHRLDIESVDIVANGQVVASDAHAATTGARNENNTYTVNIPAAAGTRYTLRARVRSDGGADSNGEVRIEKL